MTRQPVVTEMRVYANDPWTIRPEEVIKLSLYPCANKVQVVLKQEDVDGGRQKIYLNPEQVEPVISALQLLVKNANYLEARRESDGLQSADYGTR